MADNPFAGLAPTPLPEEDKSGTTEPTPNVEPVAEPATADNQTQTTTTPEPITEPTPTTPPEPKKGVNEPFYQTKYQSLKADYDKKMEELERVRTELASNPIYTPPQPTPQTQPQLQPTAQPNWDEIDILTPEGQAEFQRRILEVQEKIPTLVKNSVSETLAEIERQNQANLRVARATTLVEDFNKRNEVPDDILRKAADKLNYYMADPLGRAELVMDLIRREYKAKFKEETTAQAAVKAVEKVTTAKSIPVVAGTPPPLTADKTPEQHALGKFEKAADKPLLKI